jgi:hypothetical protein
MMCSTLIVMAVPVAAQQPALSASDVTTISTT